MTRKQIYLLAGGAAAAVLVIGIVASIWMPQPEAQPARATLVPVHQTATPAASAQGPDEAPTNAPTAMPDHTPAPTPTKQPATLAPATQAPVPAVPAVSTPAPPQKLAFPYAIPGTSLVIDAVKSYDGIFLEDGTDTPVSGVASILLRNTGSQGVDYAEILLTGQQSHLKFVVSSLPAGATVAVQAEGKASYISQDYTAATADAAMAERFPLSEGILQIEETDGDALKITNLTGADIPCVRVFYKFCMQPENVYVGGITYVAKVENLKAGASVQITPSHYAKGSSRVVMAKTYDTAEE